MEKKKQKLQRFNGGVSENYDRVENDYYATPPMATTEFLTAFKQDMWMINTALEPSCGEGHMSEVIKDFFPNIQLTSTDLVDRGYGVGGVDFITDNFARTDLVITNPPFKLAKEFVLKGLTLSNKYVIMFLKIQFLESKDRKALFDSTPLKYIYVHSERRPCWQNGVEINPNTGKAWSSPQMYAWYVWDVEYEGEPIIRWL